MAKPDAFAQHEVLHTASILLGLWEEYVVDADATQADPELKAAGEATFEAMFDFYQLCGRKFLVEEALTDG